MRSKDYMYEDEYEDLKEAEFAEQLFSKQMKRIKAGNIVGGVPKKQEIRKKRKQKEKEKTVVIQDEIE